MAKYEDLVSEEDWLLAVDGRAWVFGDDVGRRQILDDGQLTSVPAVAATHLMQALDPGFAGGVERGDFVVAGLNFAADVNQKSVVAALAHLGISAVIARSFGHFFFKNAIHLGLPAVVIEETGAIQRGDRLRLDVEAHIVANKSSGDRYVIRNLTDGEIEILRAGSLVTYTRQRRERDS